jgi:hypothetical protein
LLIFICSSVVCQLVELRLEPIGSILGLGPVDGQSEVDPVERLLVLHRIALILPGRRNHRLKDNQQTAQGKIYVFSQIT